MSDALEKPRGQGSEQGAGQSVVIAVAPIITAVVMAIVVAAAIVIVPAALIAVAPAVVTAMMVMVGAAGGEQDRGEQGKLGQAGQHDDFLESTGGGRWRGYDRRFAVWFPGWAVSD